jgi:alkyldihydroxyacetonephosphate synthase
VVNNEPRKKEKLKWNGWGYTDTKFVFNKEGNLYLSGHRYSLSGVELPSLRAFVEKEMGVTIDDKMPAQAMPTEYPAPVENPGFMKAIEGNYVRMSQDGLERLGHSHGHTVQELWELRYGKLARIVDLVVYPGRLEDVEAIVRAAHEHNAVIIPYGGGTSVSCALLCPTDETRMIVSVDMHEMDKIKWVDRTNMTACIEAGIAGKDLVRKLEDIGLTMGHEPDSLEFSTLGGWIATRASGMKKNVYGNIEDIVVTTKTVTALGTWTRETNVPRVSAGPDVPNLILGSEGTLGIVVEAVVKVRLLPEVRRFGAVAFPNFESGVKFMHEVAMRRAQPASIRLVDPEQFRFGASLKPATSGWFHQIKDKAVKFYVTKYLQFDPNDICAVTIVMEGTEAEVKHQEKIIYAVAKRHNGLKADKEAGRRGYFLTFVIAYLRDLGMEMAFLSESFETSVPWSKTHALCIRVKERIHRAAREAGIKAKLFVSCRVTQTYDAGACVYFYFGFSHKGLDNPVEKFTYVEHSAREEILECGGSISHHHGIGKHRKDFIERAIQPLGIHTLRGIKHTLDPKNIFAAGNIFELDPAKEAEQKKEHAKHSATRHNEPADQ